MSRDDIRAWILQEIRLHNAGWTTLADQLNDAKVPTLSGGVIWYPSTVKSLYDRNKVSKRGGDRWPAAKPVSYRVDDPE